MRSVFGRKAKVSTEVTADAGLAPRDSVLAAARAEDGTWLLGTRDALVLVPARSAGGGGEGPPAEAMTGAVRTIPWERVETADWDRDLSRLRVSEVADFGRERPVHMLTVLDPGSLLPMIRERVTASVVLQRRVVISGKRGLTVIARRPPRGRGEIAWAYMLDDGIDPTDPLVAEAAERGLRAAQEELGSGEQAT